MRSESLTFRLLMVSVCLSALSLLAVLFLLGRQDTGSESVEHSLRLHRVETMLRFFEKNLDRGKILVTDPETLKRMEALRDDFDRPRLDSEPVDHR